jgi:hypothetical protein
MVQGGLSATTRTCGNTNCACHRDPSRRHGPHLYLTFRREGKSCSLYVPPEHAAAVKEAQAAWARFWELGCELASLNRTRLQRAARRATRKTGADQQATRRKGRD